MSRGGWALRQALYTAITGDAGLQALIGNPPRLYDDVPADGAFPFVTFGDGVSQDWSTKDSLGAIHTITLHAWSRYEGHKEAQQILEALEAALQDATLTITGHTLVNIRFVSSQIIHDPDGATTHGVIRFRAVTEPTS
ncbi:DUF3168 domain-containing protein [bacterium AH-315-P15]|nr:DUF3168 domain-containing protein [bacterium AH-315-P15]